MFDSVLKIAAPHYCYGCDKIGDVLCDNCKYDIISEPYTSCIVCTKPSPIKGVCMSCVVPYAQAWCVGAREGSLKRLINDFKFSHVRSASDTLVNVLDSSIPELPEETIVVSVPTIMPHIRRRGYDHAALLAKKFAKRRKLPYRKVLVRTTNTVQHGASKVDRIRQAAEAFRVRERLDDFPPVLLIDDIVTTGESLANAARLLKEAGAGTVFVGVIAKQPFHSRPQE